MKIVYFGNHRNFKGRFLCWIYNWILLVENIISILTFSYIHCFFSLKFYKWTHPNSKVIDHQTGKDLL